MRTIKQEIKALKTGEEKILKVSNVNKEKELYLVNIYTEYHTPKYMYDRRTLNLTFETKENERLILKLSKDDLIELKKCFNEVMESVEL